MADVHEMTIAVVGAGTMGRGIAQSVVSAGHRAILVDEQNSALELSRSSIERSLARSIERGSLAEDTAREALSRLETSTQLRAARTAEIVIEAVPENVALKRRLFAELGEYLNASAIVATNTSAIRLAALADALPDPARFVGLHYFFPAASNKLLEVVRGPLTSAQSFSRACAFAQATDKVPLPCRDSNGFVVNRFFAPWLNEAVRLDDTGEERAAIEQAGLASFGVPFGPFKLMVLTKTEIALHATTQLAALGAFYGPASGLARQVASGQEWDLPQTPAAPTPPPPRLVERLRAAVWFAIGQLLDEGVCEPAAIELGASVGLRWTTSPIAAFRADPDHARSCVDRIAARWGASTPRSLATL